MIGVLVAALRRLTASGHRLELIVPAEARGIRRALKVMGIAAIVPTHVSREAATASIGALRAS